MKTSGLFLTLLSIAMPLLTALVGDNLLEKLGLVKPGDKTTIWLAVSVVTTLVAVPVLLSLWNRPRLGSGASAAYGAGFLVVLIGTIWDVTTTTLGLAYTLMPNGMTEVIAISIGVFLLVMYLTLAVFPQFLRGVSIQMVVVQYQRNLCSPDLSSLLPHFGFLVVLGWFLLLYGY